jgi:hypothetical protein
MKSKLTRLSALCLMIMLAGFSACNSDKNLQNGRIGVSITDAPLEVGDVKAVYISILGVELNGKDGWQTLETYENPVSLNLLDYQNGKSLFLTEEELPVGEYQEIRLLLDIPQQDQGVKSNPGCFVEYADGRIEPLFVPSGAQSGYKVKGKFDIIPGGLTNVTLDFDVRKALVKAGSSGKHLLKPTVRLVVNELAGRIDGEVKTQVEYTNLVVFAYKQGEYKDAEAADPVTGESRFPNAVTSAAVDTTTNQFVLAFMEPGKYDLVFASYSANGEFDQVLASLKDYEVKSREALKVVAEF